MMSAGGLWVQEAWADRAHLRTRAFGMKTQTMDAGRVNRPGQAEQAGRWIEQILGPPFSSYRKSKGWSPAVNVYEQGDRFCVIMDLAGVRVEDIRLVLDGTKVSISGRRAIPALGKDCGDVSVHMMEIDHGEFQRSFELPVAIDNSTIEASYCSGFLEIWITKA